MTVLYPAPDGTLRLKTLAVPAPSPSPTPTPVLTVKITSPANCAVFPCNSHISFAGSAVDPIDGDISSKIQWFGPPDRHATGATVTMTWNCDNKHVGVHTVTATVKNSKGKIVTASVQISITGRT